jgi:alginate O-acetyltransferase complex protein AlgI
MEIDSISFLPFVFVMFVVHSVLAEKIRRVWIFAAANAAFLWLTVNQKIDLWPLALLVASGYVLARIQVYQQSTWLKLGAVLLVVGQFVYFKGYAFLSSLGIDILPFFALGMSYLLFRILHLIIDSSENHSFAPGSFVDYFAYVTFFPAFNSGPVQLYPDFRKSTETPQTIQATDIQVALFRIVKGYFKCIVLSKIISTLQQDLYAHSVQDGNTHLLFATLACIGFLATLYINFSGYSDVVIGIARLFGVVLPENFQQTFSARNFLDIWSGWHMSMSQWFKTYLFNPTVKALATRWPNMALIPWYGVAGYFLTFFIMGVWHGSTLAFCIYGLILGFGACVNKAYQELSPPARNSYFYGGVRTV